MPSKEDAGAGAVLLTDDCTTASGAPVAARGKPRSGRSRCGCDASSLFGGIVARRGETSFFEDAMTTAPDASLSFAPAGLGTMSMSASAHATTAMALSIPSPSARRALQVGETLCRDGGPVI